MLRRFRDAPLSIFAIDDSVVVEPGMESQLCQRDLAMRQISIFDADGVAKFLGRWTLGACLVLAMGTASPQPSRADDTSLGDLKKRLDQLEQDNRDLRTALSAHYDDSFIPLIADLPPSPDDVQEEGIQESEDQKKMGSLVAGYMRRLDSQSKAMFDAQNEKIAFLENKVNGLATAKPKPTSATGNYTNSGLLFTSALGNFKTHFGGTAQLDFIAPESHAEGIGGFGSGAAGNQDLTQDSTNFRRLRMRADGTMYQNIDWVSEFDFAAFVQNTSQTNPNLADNGLRSVTIPGGRTGQQGGNSLNVIQPTTVWMTFKDIPVAQNIRVGNQQDWFSIEHITSARYLDFMERAPIMDVFSGPNNNGYTPGVSVFGNTTDKMAGLQLGVYKNNAYDSGYTFSMGNAFTYGGRAIWTPYYDEESNGRYMVHTAFGTEYRTFDTDIASQQQGTNVRLRSRGDLRIVSATLTPNFCDTGNFYATGQTMIDPEFAVVWGPWTFQTEYTAGWFNGAKTTNLAGGHDIGTAFVYGGYAELLYFLTGENKSYNRQTGLFNQVVPLNNVNFAEGKYGAWQVGGRYDFMDLNSGLITGGMNQNATVGLNWFINPNIRFQFNTVFSYINNNATANANPAAGIAGSAAATSGAISGAKFTGEGLYHHRGDSNGYQLLTKFTQSASRRRS